MEAEYERDYSDFVDNRFTVNGTYYDDIYNFKEIYAVYLVKRELAKCNYNLELDNVPWGQDVTEHFLFDTKEGFCQHLPVREHCFCGRWELRHGMSAAML